MANVDFANGFTRETLGFTDPTYRYAHFKNDGAKALVLHFGRPQ